MQKIALVLDSDLNTLNEFEGEFVGERGGRLIFNTPYGPVTFPAARCDWGVVEKFSYEA